MPGWNPGSAVNTVDGAYRFGVTDARRRIAERVKERAEKAEGDTARALSELAEQIRMGELDAC